MKTKFGFFFISFLLYTNTYTTEKPNLKELPITATENKALQIEKNIINTIESINQLDFPDKKTLNDLVKKTQNTLALLNIKNDRLMHNEETLSTLQIIEEKIKNHHFAEIKASVAAIPMGTVSTQEFTIEALIEVYLMKLSIKKNMAHEFNKVKETVCTLLDTTISDINNKISTQITDVNSKIGTHLQTINATTSDLIKKTEKSTTTIIEKTATEFNTIVDKTIAKLFYFKFSLEQTLEENVNKIVSLERHLDKNLDKIQKILWLSGHIAQDVILTSFSTATLFSHIKKYSSEEKKLSKKEKIISSLIIFFSSSTLLYSLLSLKKIKNN